MPVDEALAQAARQSDGSLPLVDFMRLVAGSDLIDVGTERITASAAETLFPRLF